MQMDQVFEIEGSLVDFGSSNQRELSLEWSNER